MPHEKTTSCKKKQKHSRKNSGKDLYQIRQKNWIFKKPISPCKRHQHNNLENSMYISCSKCTYTNENRLLESIHATMCLIFAMKKLISEARACLLSYLVNCRSSLPKRDFNKSNFCR